jgi:hypothetical protein
LAKIPELDVEIFRYAVKVCINGNWTRLEGDPEGVIYILDPMPPERIARAALRNEIAANPAWSTVRGPEAVSLALWDPDNPEKILAQETLVRPSTKRTAPNTPPARGEPGIDG